MHESSAEQSEVTRQSPVKSDEFPLVTVIMPVLNEERFIARSLDQVLSQDYPADRLEIIVADGRSEDRTREIVAQYQGCHDRIQLIDNPGRLRANALNLALATAKGDVIICVDGHCEVAGDFVRQQIAVLDEHPEAWCTGGPTLHVGRNTFGKATAVAMSSRVGVGNATHRFVEFEGYSDGVQFPAYRRWIFDRIGQFDEAMVRTEDDEFSFRIRQAGGKVFVTPRVKYQYYVRDTFGRLFRQYSQYSFWRIPVYQKHKRPTTVRQIVPPLFFLAVFVLLIVGIVWRQPLVALALPAVYLATLLAVGVASIPKVGLKVGMVVPVAIFTMHVAYAYGMAYGWFAIAFYHRAFDIDSPMCRQ